MPNIRYVGKHIDHRGKRLYEILLKLKNFGVGRMVYRNMFKDRYPEPSYYIITKVEPDFKDPTVSITFKSNGACSSSVALDLEVCVIGLDLESTVRSIHCLRLSFTNFLDLSKQSILVKSEKW